MRLSCNGCRVLRKGCGGDSCAIRPCLQWIKSPDAQANATVFLAKFYGRAGLLNLVAAAPTHALRPAVFRSLLYEACGRIVNPAYGAVGLLWSGTWHLCQAAVEAVLKGDPVVVVQVDAAAAGAAAAAYDIRHVFPKNSSSNKQQSHAAAGAPPPPPPAAQSKDDDEKRTLHKVLKRTSSSSSPSPLKKTKTTTTTQNKHPHPAAAASPSTEHHNDDDDMLVADHSDQEQQHAEQSRRASSGDCDRHSHSDTQEAASHVSQAVELQHESEDHQADEAQQSMALDLTLGLLTSSSSAPPPTAGCTQGGGGSSAAAVHQPAAGVSGFRFL